MKVADAQLVKVSAVLGLGNPGRRHIRNRHNFGFMVMERLGFLKKEEFVKGEGPFLFCKVPVNSDKLILCKSATFMNDAGRAALSLCQYFRLSIGDMLVVSDDCNLPLGKIRFRRRGSDGGHKGLYSIIYHLQSQEFPRLRLGIQQSPPGKLLEDYVLEDFSEKESKIVGKVITAAAELIEKLAVDGVDKSSVTITVTEE